MFYVSTKQFNYLNDCYLLKGNPSNPYSSNTHILTPSERAKVPINKTYSHFQALLFIQSLQTTHLVSTYNSNICRHYNILKTNILDKVWIKNKKTNLNQNWTRKQVVLQIINFLKVVYVKAKQFHDWKHTHLPFISSLKENPAIPALYIHIF